MKRLLLVLSFLSLCFFSSKALTVEHITSQRDFQHIRQKIIKAADSGENEIRFVFDGNLNLCFASNQLDLSGLHYPNTSLSFLGNGAVLTGKGYTEESWTCPFRAEGKIKRSGRKDGEFIISSSELPKTGRFSHILVTEWYQSRIYRVNEIKDGIIYIEADSLDQLNMDLRYSGEPARLKLLAKGSSAPSYDDGDLNKAGRLISTYGSAFASIVIENLHFKNNSNTGVTLLDFTDILISGIVIRNCEFSGIHSDIVHISGANGFSFENNHVHHCYRSGVLSDNKSPNTRVTGNCFEDCGLSLDMCSCVDCCGTDYYVADNVFRNFGSRAVSAGVYFTSRGEFKSSGIIENNLIYYNRTWVDTPSEYTLMDSGAVYLTSFSDNVVVRFNRIYDYVGMKDNRGIFCDDGASGFSIYGNVVTGIANSYAIDARRTPSIEARSGGRRVNVNNYIGYNVLEGAVRFEGRLAGTSCTKDPNYVLQAKGSILPGNDISSVKQSGRDITLNVREIKDGVVILSPSSFRRIRRWKYYPQMQQYFSNKK